LDGWLNEDEMDAMFVAGAEGAEDVTFVDFF
jgi:hypothetical protein